MIRVVYVDTDLTGAEMTATLAEGTLRAVREDPHGVVLLVGREKRSIRKESLADLGRFFLAAALALGEDVNGSDGIGGR